MYLIDWATDHPAVLLTLVALGILTFAWPQGYVLACVLAVVMMVAAAGITLAAHLRSAG